MSCRVFSRACNLNLLNFINEQANTQPRDADTFFIESLGGDELLASAK